MREFTAAPRTKNSTVLSTAGYACAYRRHLSDPLTSDMSILTSAHGAISIEILTARLRLRSVTHGDVTEYHRLLYGNPVVMSKFADGVPRSEDAVRSRIDGWVKRLESGDPFAALTILTPSETDPIFIGTIVIGYGSKPGTSEVAYLLREGSWGLGYGGEAARAVTQHLAPVLRLHGFGPGGSPLVEIEATVRPDNPASERILVGTDFNLHQEEMRFGALRRQYKKSIGIPQFDSPDCA